MKVAGFGFRGAATSQSLWDAYAATGQSADALATPEDKAATPAFQDFAARIGVPVHAIPETQIVQTPTRTQSQAALATRGTGSVAEAAALAAAGQDARLVTPRQISQDRLATCAVAESEAL